MEYEAEETGEPRVDAVIAGLGRLGDLPLDEHVAVFEDTHTQLRQVLNELDAEPAGQAGAGDGADQSPSSGDRAR
jgi:hypothetical protein